MSWRLHMVPCHVSTVEFRTLLSNVEKTDVNVASNYAFNGQVKGDSQAQRAAVQHIDIDRWDLKKGWQFTLLRRITNSKV